MDAQIPKEWRVLLLKQTSFNLIHCKQTTNHYTTMEGKIIFVTLLISAFYHSA